MYLKINNKKIKIKELNTFKERFKSLKFKLAVIDYGVLIPNKKLASTYFFCQRVDICFTDKENKIVDLLENVKSEKRYLRFKSHNIYYLPLNTCKYLKVNETLKIKKD